MLLFLLAVPGTLWRTAGDGFSRARTGELTVMPLALGPPREEGEGVSLAGTWRLSSSDTRFGGYSALTWRTNGRLRAYSDSGLWLEFDAPDRPAGVRARFGPRSDGDKLRNDVEAAAYDPASGTTWLAQEITNTVKRVGPDGTTLAVAAPPAMADFAANGGAESMARLPDGRFIVLAESAKPFSPMRRTALLFPQDPTLDERAIVFAFDPPAGYDPTDAAALPDGRVLILLRALKLGPWPFFRSKLVIADPALIRAGEPWPWREVADLSAIAPLENYEGLAVEPGGGGLVLWVISDANRSVLLQRTLLLKLVWRTRCRRLSGEGLLRRPCRPS